MEGLGLTTPVSLFNTQAEAAGLIVALLAALKAFGKTATIGELIGARLEKLLVVGAVRATYYIGAAIGSFAVATGRYAACGASISDVMLNIHQNGITPPSWLHPHFVRHPEILDKKHMSRLAYVHRAKR